MRITSGWRVVIVFVAGVALAAVTAGQSARPAPVPGNGTLLDDLVVANRILANENILDGLGHVSARSLQHPDHFFMARDLAPGLVTANDLVEYDLDGKAVDAKAPTGVRERFIHASIYKARPDVQSVVHSHMPSVLPFTDSSVALRPMYHMAPFLLAGAPVWDIRTVPGQVGMLVDNNKAGASLAQMLGNRTVALMRGHGAAIVGVTIPDAVSNAIFLDVNARVQAQAIALGGKISYLTPADVEAGGVSPQPAAPMGTPGYYPRSWPIWKAKAMGEKR
ncbi:MAG TPA: class II aldolase/adducin family protein [Vicinamibacterales bacterium]|jgi:ribulose-5-phosphate 4-epimerase/fuculose-1-phosphate aldolase|nr:class II aldolase/adducin family protein [Vicinamibacterales bacterium]